MFEGAESAVGSAATSVAPAGVASADVFPQSDARRGHEEEGNEQSGGGGDEAEFGFCQSSGGIAMRL